MIHSVGGALQKLNQSHRNHGGDMDIVAVPCMETLQTTFTSMLHALKGTQNQIRFQAPVPEYYQPVGPSLPQSCPKPLPAPLAPP